MRGLREERSPEKRYKMNEGSASAEVTHSGIAYSASAEKNLENAPSAFVCRVGEPL